MTTDRSAAPKNFVRGTTTEERSRELHQPGDIAKPPADFPTASEAAPPSLACRGACQRQRPRRRRRGRPCRTQSAMFGATRAGARGWTRWQGRGADCILEILLDENIFSSRCPDVQTCDPRCGAGLKRRARPRCPVFSSSAISDFCARPWSRPFEAVSRAAACSREDLDDARLRPRGASSERCGHAGPSPSRPRTTKPRFSRAIDGRR